MDQTGAPRSRPEDAVVVARDGMVPMRDGVRLATDIYRPARDGEPLGRHTHTQVAVNTIHYDRDHPSHLVLPVIPAAREEGAGALRRPPRGRVVGQSEGGEARVSDATSPTATRPQPLAGVRVLEFGQAVSSPLCTMLLGDLGADVVKIEPPHGDAARGYGPPFVAGESPYFLSVNRNKRSAVINLKHPEGAALVRRLAERADIIVTNFRPGVMERLGLGDETLRAVNPGLIFCQVSGYGPRGPYAGQPSYDQIAQGMSGLMSVTGTPESGPVRVGVAIADCLAALFATIGVLGAFAERQRTGLGQRVDTSLLGAVLGILTYQTGGYLAGGGDPPRVGNDHPVAAPYGAFPVKDGHINIAVASEPVWRRLAEAVGHPEWIDDPRFASNAERVRHRPVLNALLTEALAGDTVDGWVARLNAAGVPCGPIWSIGQALESDVVRHLGIVQQVQHDRAGLISLIGPAIELTATPPVIRRPPPLLGQHTDEVLGELGLDAAERARLRAAGAIG